MECGWGLAGASKSKAGGNIEQPKVLFKVLRGRKITAIADPWGIIAPTEKIVSLNLTGHSPEEILATCACCNSWIASFFLQKLLFSDTTESARVMDYPYLKFVTLL